VNVLRGVDGTSGELWAVGFRAAGPFQAYGGLAEHWAGVRWSIVPTPPVGNGAGLEDVTVVSHDDVWAVGDRPFNGPHRGAGWSRVLIERWDGTAWRTVQAPNPGRRRNELLGVDAASANDVWAVGLHTTGRALSEVVHLVLHWDGVSGTAVPGVGGGGWSDVVAIAADRASAVGGPAARRDGRAWTAMEMPADFPQRWARGRRGGSGPRRRVGVTSVRGRQEATERTVAAQVCPA